MAILTSVGTKVKKGLVKAADAGGNVVAKASGLTSDQLKNIEERREAYLSNRPEMDPERIVRCIGAFPRFLKYTTRLSLKKLMMP